eukprot:TRINITY_DN4178_c0_g1_i4.p2 TRINITY_DN4178_c0_g1~~TRINITY_DN4178_c0_g1_i4.p2  ORF type:complete len:313 (+),score=104.35 TRINITY_DN4178_c0_g1_i4:68-1006(+)
MQEAARCGGTRSYEAERPARKPSMQLVDTAELDQQAKQLRDTEHELSRTREQLAAATLELATATAAIRERDGIIQGLLLRAAEDSAAAERAAQQGAIAAQRAVRAEMRLLPHSEITERCRVEIAEGEALRRLADSMRTPSAAAAAERQGAAGSRVILQSRSSVENTAAVAVHPDAGWFLTLNIIALSVAPFAPRRWAPLCRDTAEAVCNVHKFWHNAAVDVTISMATALGLRGDMTNEWRQPLQEWKMLITGIRQAQPSDEGNKWKLELHARKMHNILEHLQLQYNETMESMRCTMERIRATRRVIQEVLGK